MNQEQTYVVNLTLEVKANSREDIVKATAQEIVRQAMEGTLKLASAYRKIENVEFETREELEEFIENATNREIVELVLYCNDITLEEFLVFGEYENDEYRSLPESDRIPLLEESINGFSNEELVRKFDWRFLD